MSDSFVFAGFGYNQPAEENNDTNITNINIEEELLNKPIVLIDVKKAKKGYETIVTGLTESYIKRQNPNLTADTLIKKFQKKKGCNGTKKEDENNPNIITIVFRGKQRDDLEEFLLEILNLDDDQLRVKGI